MKAYIDFANFCSYLSSMSNQDFYTCNEVLLSAFNLCFTFDKSEIQKAKKDIKRNFDLWLKTATKNRNGKKNEWNINFPPRPVHKSSHESFSKEELSSVYMLEDDNVKEFAEAGCLLVAEKGKELDVIKKLKIANKFIPTKQFSIRSLTDWTTFGENSTPCTDILIVDKFIFAQSDLEYDVNSYSLIEQLCKWAKSTAINIVIFTFKDYKDNDQRRDVPFKTIERSLKDRLSQLIGVEPYITFVILPDKVKHDRTIITNYKMYTSGDSFKYFKDGTNVSLCTHGDWMHISSFHDDDVFQDVQDFIRDLQEIVDKVKGGLMSIMGDKRSLFLNF